MNATTVPIAREQYVQWPALIWIAFLHAGALLAIWPGFFSWSGLLLCVVLHWVTGGIGICLGYHRLLTHRSFTCPKWLEYAITITGCGASEGGAIGWVADHRRHHAHSDEEDDVHSPRHGGFSWAHFLWWMTPDVTARHSDAYLRRWAPDLMRDPVHRLLDRYFILFPLALAALLYALGGMSWLVWGFFVRNVLVLHCTWLVNSATHVPAWGYRSHETRDDSINCWWVALLTYGEGWHNNHHAYQISARHGMSWWEFDSTYLTIRLLEKVGLAKNVKLPKPTASSPTPAAAPEPRPVHLPSLPTLPAMPDPIAAVTKAIEPDPMPAV